MIARTNNKLFRTWITQLAGLRAIVLVAILFSDVSAASFNVSATVNGTNQPIGTIDANYLNYGGANGSRAQEGIFQLNNNNKTLMHDPDCQFRWFQVVTEDTDPINYLGNLLNAPYVDPPYDGWDYQRAPANDWQNGTPGADKSPFYENDDVMGAAYAYPKYSGTLNVFNNVANVPVHDEAMGVVRNQDVPGTSANNSVKFWTFLAYLDAEMAAAKEFFVLWGYSWGVNRAANGNFTYDAISEITYDHIIGNGGPGCVECTFYTALNADGFGEWTAITRDINIIPCVPEPASIVLFALGVYALLVCRRGRSTEKLPGADW
jgi:hypothetical protein